MKIHIKRESGAVVARLEGDITSEMDQAMLRNEVGPLVRGRSVRLVIDLSRVKFVSSCGLGALVCLLTTVRREGGDLGLIGVSGEVDKVIRMTHLELVLPIFSSFESAIHSAGAPAIH